MHFVQMYCTPEQSSFGNNNFPYAIGTCASLDPRGKIIYIA